MGWVGGKGDCCQPPPPTPGTPTYLAGEEMQLGDGGRLLVQARQLHAWRAVSGGGRQRNNEGRAPPTPASHQIPGQSPNSTQVTVLPASTSLAPCPWGEHPWQHPMPEPASVPPFLVGIHQAPPTGMPQARMRPTRGWGGCARARPAPALCHPLLSQPRGHGRAEAPAAPTSPARTGSRVGFGMRRHSLTHPTGPGSSAGDAAQQEPGQDPCGSSGTTRYTRTQHLPDIPRPGKPLPPSPASPVHCAAMSWHATCQGFLPASPCGPRPRPPPRCPRRREQAQRLCPDRQAGAVWQRRAQPSWQSQARATEALVRPDNRAREREQAGDSGH